MRTLLWPTRIVDLLMPSTFFHEKPLQALKLTAAISALAFGVTAIIGIFPGRVLNPLLYVAFSPVILAVIVGAEGLLTGYRVAAATHPRWQHRPTRGYTAIRIIELILTVGTPAIFYVLIVQIGDKVPGPGAIGLLFIGTGLALLAHASVVLRTLTEYYYFRKGSNSARIDEGREKVAEKADSVSTISLLPASMGQFTHFSFTMYRRRLL